MVEMIVALAVIIIILAGLISATTASITRSTDISIRTQATKLATNGIEFARNLRDQDWNEFYALSGSYYLSNGELFGMWEPPAQNGVFYTILTFTQGTPAAGQMTVESRVTWTERDTDKDIILSTVLTQWK